MTNSKGFTLIELLVVVLSIGILSAVALPQYTKAVERSRAAEAELMLRSLRDAQERCFLANGQTCESGCCQGEEGANLFDVMDISLNLPNTSNFTWGVCCGRQGKYFVYSLEDAYIYAERMQDGTELYNLEISALDKTYWNIICYDGTMSCKDIGYTEPTDSGSWRKP